jgi:hypothetical protein
MAMGCIEKVSDPKDYLERINSAESGCRLEIDRDAIRYGLVYRPADYFTARRMKDHPETPDSLLAGSQTSPGVYFAFTAKLDNADRGAAELLPDFLAYQDSWVQGRNTPIPSSSLVTAAGDTLPCFLAEATMDRVHGLSVSVFLGFAPLNDVSRLRGGKVLLRNLGFWTETLEFPLGEIRPRLKFVPKRNAVHA